MKRNLLIVIVGIAAMCLNSGELPVARAAKFDDPSVRALHESVDDMRAKAAKGDPQAQTGQGMISLYGFGGTQDLAAARSWFEKAANQGYPEAIARLANLYENGAGVEKDAAKAVALYRKAAELHYPQAEFHLGLLYLDGIGVAKDEVQGDKLLQSACDSGYQVSCGVLKWRADKLDEARTVFDVQCQAGDQLACGFLAQIPADLKGDGGQVENRDKRKGGVGIYLIIGLVLVGLLIYWLIRNDPGEEEGKVE
jgi:TPR repeat protein